MSQHTVDELAEIINNCETITEINIAVDRISNLYTLSWAMSNYNYLDKVIYNAKINLNK